MSLHVDGQIAIVTGAGSGIGQAIARMLADRGATVAVADRRLGAARETVDLITRAGGKAMAVETDVSHSVSVDAAFEQVVRAFGRVDILVNNAGIVLQKTVAETTDDEWARILSVNITGTFYCSRAAVRQMSKQGPGGKIVNISSVIAQAARPLNGAYCASKGAVDAFTRQLAVEVAPLGINVNAVAPGHIKTPLTRDMFTPTVTRAFEQRIPLGRLGEPRWIAQVVCFLCSDEADYMTGQVVYADGGYNISGDLPGLQFGPND